MTLQVEAMLHRAEYEGVWFLPGSDDQVPGTAVYAPDEGTVLRLTGTFRPEGRSVGGGADAVGTVFGVCMNGTLVTLGDCALISETIASIPTERYRASIALVGGHFAAPYEEAFEAMSFRLWNGEACIGSSAVNVQHQGHTTTASVTRSVPPAIDIDAGGFRVSTDVRVVESFELLKEVSFRQASYFTITAQSPTGIEAFVEGPAQSLQTLFELATLDRVPFLDVEAYLPRREGGGLQAPVRVLFDQRRVLPLPDRRHPPEFAFTVSSLGSRWEECFSRWQECRTQFAAAFGTNYSQSRSVGVPVEQRFLNLAQAVESYHRAAYPSRTREPAADFEARLVRLGVWLDDDGRRWLFGRLVYANEITLRERIRDLYESMPATVQASLGEREAFARSVTRTRNYLTHGSPESMRGAETEGRGILRLLLRLDAILKLALVSELGLQLDPLLQTSWGHRLLAPLRLN
jgi:ApeA N-terminal domain 1